MGSEKRETGREVRAEMRESDRRDGGKAGRDWGSEPDPLRRSGGDTGRDGGETERMREVGREGESDGIGGERGRARDG